MSIYSDALLQSQQMMSENEVRKSNAAITVKCTVVDIIDAGLGHYSVKYGDNLLDAYSFANATFQKNDIVYVHIPDGDFSNRKMIIGAEAPKATMLVPENESDTYVPITPNLFDLMKDQIDLQSWTNEIQEVERTGQENFGTQFSDYLDTYKNFVFSANIKTEINKDHQMKGNYGLRLTLPFLQKGEEGTTVEVLKTFSMDVSNMPGNPYNFSDYQKVNLYFNINDDLTYNPTLSGNEDYDKYKPYKLEAFVDGFGYNAIPAQSDLYDIHIRDINFKMIDILSEEEQAGYYLTIVSDTGNYFIGDQRSKVLSPLLKVKGKTSNVSKWSCYWFVEDSSINPSSDRYVKDGGIGWKCLNEKINVSVDEEGNQSFQYNTSDYTYTVKPEDVLNELKYKCVLIQGDIYVSSIITLKNLYENNIQIQLFSSTGSTQYVADIGNVVLTGRIYYPGITDGKDKKDSSITVAWQRFDKNGRAISTDVIKNLNYARTVKVGDKTYWAFEVYYPCSELDELNTVQCTFYEQVIHYKQVSADEREPDYIEVRNLGTKSITVTTVSGITYTLAIQGGDVLYKYDADGDSPLVANYDGPATSKLTTIYPISFKVFKADGTELTDEEYRFCKYKWSFPKNSMMTLKGYDTIPKEQQDDNYYYLEGYGNKNAIEYTIRSAFNKKRNNNSILLEAHFDNVDLVDSITPKFLKDGMGGTNGSKYAAVINYQGYAYGERDGNNNVRKLQVLYIADNKKWYIRDPEIDLYKIITDPVTQEQTLVPQSQLVEFNNPQLGIEVFKDGEKLDGGFSVNWSMFDVTYTNPCLGIERPEEPGETKRLQIRTKEQEGQVIPYNWDDATYEPCNVVEAKITVGNEGITKSQEYIYAYYPIEITRVKEAEMIDKVIPNIEGGFEEVVFASDGTNPSYDNTNDFKCIDNLYNEEDEEKYNYYDYEWAGSPCLTITKDKDKEYIASAKPNTKFDDGKLSKNFIKATLKLSEELRDDLQQKIDNLQEERTSVYKLQQLYANNEIKLNEFIKLFNYDDYIQWLDGHEKIYDEDNNETILNLNTKTFLSYRSEMLMYLTKMLSAIDEIYDYCYNNNNPKISSTDFFWNTWFGPSGTTRNSLNSAYSYAYKLGAGASLDLLKDLANTIINIDAIALRNKYNAGVVSQLVNLVNTYNALVPKYQTALIAITGQINNVYIYQPEYDSFARLEQSIIDLPHNSNLSILADALEEFKILKDQLISLTNLISNTEGGLTDYASFVSNLLDPMNNLLLIYQDKTYQDEYYAKLDDELSTQINNLDESILTYKDLLTPESTDAIIHIKPIVMLFNRYELSNINGWDGNKLYIDEKNNEYILAPQFGAGKKNDDNSFDGVIMGVKQFNSSDSREQRIGLIGYYHGIQTFLLNSNDGSAIFGKRGKGQIYIDPSNEEGRIYSGNFYKDDNLDQDGKPKSYARSYEANEGMLINLTLPEIRFGNGNFSVNDEGNLRAAGEGWIGGWKINDTQIYSNVTEGKITLDSGAKLIVDDDNNPILDDKGHKQYTQPGSGKIYSHNHSTLTDTNTGFYLSKDGLSVCNSTRSRIQLSTEGDPVIYSNSKSTLINPAEGFHISNDGISLGSKAKITSDGVLKLGTGAVEGTEGSKHWTIDGGSNSYIAYATTEFNAKPADGTISGSDNQVYIGTNGIRLGSKFAVDDQGNLLANQIIANTKGKIGGWEIDGNQLKNTTGNIFMDGGNGIITCGIGDNALKLTAGKLNGPGFVLSNTGLTVENPQNQSSLNWGDGFSVSTGGILKAKGAIIEGTIYAGAGEIGGWTIGETSLYNGDAYLNSNGDFRCKDLVALGTITTENLSVGGALVATKGTYTVTGTINGGAIPFSLQVEI